MAKDPYKLLGLTKSASSDDISKAYRKLAKKYHPDVNQGNEKVAEKFKEISAAYTLLSDKKLKAQYDRGQIDGTGQQRSPFGAGGFGAGGFGGFNQRRGRGGGQGPMGAMGGNDMNDLLQSLFGMQMGSMGGGMSGGMGGMGPQPKKGKDIRYRVKLSLFEALKGGSRKIKGRDGKSFSVKIPKAIDDGKTLRVRGLGASGVNGGAPGDAKVEIEVLKDKYFQREGQNLRLKLPISLQEALLGAKIKISMPEGHVQLNIPAGTNSGTTLRLRGKGIKGGDLLVSPQIVLEDKSAPELLKWAKLHTKSDNFDPRKGMTDGS